MKLATINLVSQSDQFSNVPMPITTRNPVQNLPRSSSELPELSTKSSGLENWPQIQLGSGARTKVATTSNG